MKKTFSDQDHPPLAAYYQHAIRSRLQADLLVDVFEIDIGVCSDNVLQDADYGRALDQLALEIILLRESPLTHDHQLYF